MTVTSDPTPTTSRLEHLLGYLATDPANLRLLGDAASAAFDIGDKRATDLLRRYAQVEELPPALRNLGALIDIQEERFTDAALALSELRLGAPDDVGIAFNLAWSLAMLGDHGRVVEILDEATTTALSQAAALKVQSLHSLGRLDEALEYGRVFNRLHPDAPELMAALAVAAIDGEDPELARACAARAGERHEGLSTLGLLDLDQGDVEGSLQLFERALRARPDSARGHLGMGLGLMAKGDSAAAAPHIDQSAEIFIDHLGSWVAAAWAYFAAGDYVTSRLRFETALALDDTFAEVHGGLAVLDIVANDLEGAKRRADVALRLDRNCLAGALARSLILMREGDHRTAERIQQIALNMPLGASGGTIAQAAVKFGLAGRKE